MKEGDVAILAVPQADGNVKNRPTVILREMPPFKDMLVCGVSTQLRHAVKDFDELISPADNDFSASGRLAESLIRLGFLAVVPQNQIVGTIGFVSAHRHGRLLRKLDYLMK